MRVLQRENLRTGLRDATRQGHDALDLSMRDTGWRDRASYGRFLQMQHAARAPIEKWAGRACPAELSPPPQTRLIEDDLAELGIAPVAPPYEFELPENADPIGLAWAIAGSSLGNRAILHDISKSAEEDLPTRFLADESMTSFWNSLRPALGEFVSDQEKAAATLAALAVFDHFRATVNAIKASREAL